MAGQTRVVFPREKRLMADFGERLRLARLRRNLGVDIVAQRAAISRMTLYRAEAGSPAVALGVYLRLLLVLGLQDDLNHLAADDQLGRKLQDLRLPQRQRAKRRPDV